MRRVRVTQAMRSQLDRHRNAYGNVRRGGVMVVPQVLSVDAWDAIAAPAQERLLMWARGDSVVKPVETSLPDPADVTHRYKTRGIAR